MIIGIDLGTTYSCVASDGEIIVDSDGSRTTPSFVSVKDGEITIGTSAKNKSTKLPKNTFYDIKRLIGNKYSDIQGELQYLSYDVLPDENDNIVIDVEGKLLSPEEVSGMLLKKLKDNVESSGETIEGCIITVPAYFNENQRSATMLAGKLAGLEVMRIIDEPTAASLAYMHKYLGEDITKNILIVDIGGGTTDLTLLNMELEYNIINILATNGDMHFGGIDFDNALSSYWLENTNMMLTDKLLVKLRKECERAKKELSSSKNAIIDVNDEEVSISRNKFDSLIMPQMNKLLTMIKDILFDGNLTRDDIDEIILVGGSTRIPKIRSTLESYFGQKPICSLNPDEVVAIGASIKATNLHKISKGEKVENNSILIDVVPLSLGVKTACGEMDVIIKRNTSRPIRKKATYSTYRDNQTSVCINVYEGERVMAEDNIFLDTFRLTGIIPRPKGMAKIEVEFYVDTNGLLTVSAIDTGSKNKTELTINRDSYDEDKIKSMVETAEKMAEDDNKKKEELTVLDNFETYLYGVQTSVQMSTISDRSRKEILDLIDDELKWIQEKQTTEDIRDKHFRIQAYIEEVLNECDE